MENDYYSVWYGDYKKYVFDQLDDQDVFHMYIWSSIVPALQLPKPLEFLKWWEPYAFFMLMRWLLDFP